MDNLSYAKTLLSVSLANQVQKAVNEKAARHRRVLPNSFLLAHPDEMPQIFKTVPPGPIQDNFAKSVISTNIVIGSICCIHLIENEKVIEHFKKNPNGRPISERLQDKDKWIIYQVSKHVNEIFPACIVDEAMDLWKYLHYGGNSDVTFKKKYRKLQEAIFHRRGTYEQRLRIDTLRGYKQLSPEDFYNLIQSPEYRTVMEHAKFIMDYRYRDMSPSAQAQFTKEFFADLDYLITHRIYPDFEQATIKPLQQWIPDNTSDDQNAAVLIDRRTQATYRMLKNIADNHYDYKHVDMYSNFVHDEKEARLNELNERPNLATDFKLKRFKK